MENHHFQWENPLFLWQFSIAMLVYQRVFLMAHLGDNTQPSLKPRRRDPSRLAPERGMTSGSALSPVSFFSCGLDPVPSGNLT